LTFLVLAAFVENDVLISIVVSVVSCSGGCSGCGEEDLLVHCLDCKASFCSQCNITIHQPIKFKAHRRRAVEAREVVESLCHVHNEKLKIYCFSSSCQAPICILCTTIGTHKSHDFRPIQDVFVAEKQEFKVKLQQELALLSELEAVQREMAGDLDALSQKRVHAASVIRADYRDARKKLDEQEQQAVDALNAHVEERGAPLKAVLDGLHACSSGSVSKRNSKLLFASSL
jgi:hypothetical protein